MNEQLSASLAWIDNLHEVGDPIRKRRAEILSLLEQAQRLERQALALRGRAIGAHFALVDTVLQHWTEEEVARARAAATKPQPLPEVHATRPLGELTVQVGGLTRRVSLADHPDTTLTDPDHCQALPELADAGPDIAALSDRLERMRGALELALQAIDTREARGSTRGASTVAALRAICTALDKPWPTDAS